MSERLPSGWISTTIGEILGKLQYGLTASAAYHTEGPRFLRITDINNGLINWDTVPSCELKADSFEKYKLNDGDIVFARTGSIEKACMIRRPPAAVFASYLIRGKPPLKETSHWLHHFVNSYGYWRQARELSAGIGRANLNAKNLSTITLSLPPLPEQHRIVEAIESYLTRLDAAVALLERVQRNLKRYRASVLKAAVEGRLVPTEAELAKKEGRTYEPASELLKRILVERRKKWIENAAEKARDKAEKKAREAGKPWTHADDVKTLEKERAKAAKKYKEPAAPDLSALRAQAGTTNLPDLPEGWCWSTVEQLGVITSGQTPKGISEEISSEGDISWFRVGDMNLIRNETEMIEATSWLTLAQVHKLGLHVQPAGTIIFPKRGGAIMTNKKRRLVRASSYDLNTMGVVPTSLASEYIWLWFRQLNLSALSDGSNVPQINHGDIAPLHVPFPPFAEQLRIVAKTEQALGITRVISVEIDRNVVRSQRLRQSILKWAFEGKLVEQDPEDEPASVLLERIKAKRESMQPRKRRRTIRKKKDEQSKHDEQLDLLGGRGT